MIELAERLVEQGILSYDDLSVMEITDLVNTIEGLTEEQAVEIVARAEVLAEEQTEELPRRKGSRGSSSEPAPVAELVSEEDDSETLAGSSETVADGELGSAEADFNQAAAIADAAVAEDGSALATEPEAATAGEPFSDDSTDPERDLASEEEIHDVALAVESSSYSPQGHEVTSPPSELDQGDGIRIVTEAVEQPAPKRSAGASPSTSRANRAPETAAGEPGNEQ